MGNNRVNNTIDNEIDQFNESIKTSLENTVKGNFADFVKDVITDEVLNGIVYSYEASETAMRTRRYGKDGGLADKDSMITQTTVRDDISTTEIELEITDIAEWQDGKRHRKDLSDVVESGEGYRQPYPRPFMGNAESRINKDLTVAEIIVGFIEKGLE